ncbi:MAG: CpaF family protein [Eggerthellaceae bacterium]|nr:CpaF family protein [Eggerthellaceae bacterium]
MSLMERVRAAGLDNESAELPQINTDLKEQLSVLLPPQRLAQLAGENPKLAESEIRNACERLFQESPWLAVQGYSADALTESVVNDVFGLGPLEPYLADESVTEIMINGTQSFYIEKDGKVIAQPMPFADDEAIRTLVDRILGPLGRRVDESSPMVDARLMSGHRVNAVIPPISPDGPMVTVRKFAQQVLSLEDLEKRGTLDACMRTLLTWAVQARKNIAISGGTGSGKTTLLNALSCKMSHDERIVTIEDSAELRFLEHPHVVRMEARVENAEGKGEVSIRDLVRNSLRMRPDRIIVGEVRGVEAWDMLSAMNTGHDGSATTLHANSPADAIMRLTTMVRFAADLPLDAIEAQIGGALDMMVQISRYRDGSRRVSQISELDFDYETRKCKVIPLYVRESAHDAGQWYAAPSWLESAQYEGLISAGEVHEWMQSTSLRLPAA